MARRRIRNDDEERDKLEHEQVKANLEKLTEPGGWSGDPYPRPGPAWGEVVEQTFAFEPVSLHARLRDQLSLGDEAFADYATVVHALDRAEKNAVDARRLHRGARLEELRFEAVIAERIGAMREQAADELERDKAAGKRSKAATKDDIEARMRTTYPDEYRALEERKARLHGTVAVMDELAGAWRSRCATLRVMAERLGRG